MIRNDQPSCDEGFASEVSDAPIPPAARGIAPAPRGAAAPGPATEPGGGPALAVVERLIEILGRENAALATGDLGALGPLLPEKRLACRAWEDTARTLTSAAEAGAGPVPERREALRAALERLERTSGENRSRLGAMLVAHRRVVEVIAGALQAHDAPTSAYGRTGARAGRSGPGLPPRAVGFDCAT